MHISAESRRQLLDDVAKLSQEEFKALSPEDQAAVAKAQDEQDEEDRRNECLLDFIPRITPRWVRPEHLAPFANIFERAQHEQVLACVSVPPRHGKTELILHAIAWWLSRRPHDTLGYASYGAEIAESKSMLARDYARSAGIRLRDDRNTLNEWRTPSGGGCLAAGVGGAWTGQGIIAGIIDDPFKNRVEAESPLIRQRIWDWFTSTLTTRVEPGGSRIVVHTRWHEDDLIGRLLASTEERWDLINLPAIDDSGAALWPDRWPSEELEKKRRAVGTYDWWSLFQGQPRPRGGQMFADPVRYTEPNINDARIVLSVDAAGTEGTHSDYTAAVAMAVRGYESEMTADVLEVMRVRLEPQKAALPLREFQARHGGGGLLIEATRDGKSLRKALEAIDNRLVIREVPPLGDKLIRATPCAAAWSQGRIRVPLHAPWLSDFLAETSKFTGLGDLHDDQVDAMSQAWNEAAKSYPYKMHRVCSER